MRHRLLLGAATAAVLLALSAPLAAAVAPNHGSYSADIASTMSGVCAFDVSVRAHLEARYTQTLDQAGNQTMWLETGVEQDTFTAHGHTLVGLPFRYVGDVHSDADGTWTSYHVMGGIERVPLPDGSVFWSAGRFDWLGALGQGVTFTLTPDNGHSGNVDAFCAALS